MLQEKLNHPIFDYISQVACELDVKAYIVGGWVRDMVLDRKSKDIDIVVLGNGIEFAGRVSSNFMTGKSLAIFKNYGTAMLRIDDLDIEFVGARKESYKHDSRKPIVDTGTFEEDISRRDFTINTLAISLNKSDFGSLIDTFGGLQDIAQRIIKTPLDPNITYSDDPLRMIRAVRFATQLGFDISPESLKAISHQAKRIGIVSVERITDEFHKIIMSSKPGDGIKTLHATGLLKEFFPELAAMHGTEWVNGKTHKDNFYHSLKVLDNICEKTDNLWLRWAALLHDIGKPRTRQYDSNAGWTFHGHEFLGDRKSVV